MCENISHYFFVPVKQILFFEQRNVAGQSYRAISEEQTLS